MYIVHRRIQNFYCVYVSKSKTLRLAITYQRKRSLLESPVFPTMVFRDDATFLFGGERRRSSGLPAEFGLKRPSAVLFSGRACTLNDNAKLNKI